MDKKGRQAQEQVQLAEAEFQVLRQEMVLQHLIDTGEPTDEARALLERLRSAATELAKHRPPPDADDDPASRDLGARTSSALFHNVFLHDWNARRLCNVNWLRSMNLPPVHLDRSASPRSGHSKSGAPPSHRSFLFGNPMKRLKFPG